MMARAKKSADEKSAATLTFRLSTKEADELWRLALARRVSLSALLREQSLKLLAKS